MQARLQVWSGSSMSTTGTCWLPSHQFFSCHRIMSVAMWSGNRMSLLVLVGSAAGGGRRLGGGGDRRDLERGHYGNEPARRHPLLAREPAGRRPEPRAERKRRQRAGGAHLAARLVDHVRAGG